MRASAENKIHASRITDRGHLALNYALAETRGGIWAKRFQQTKQLWWKQEKRKPPFARASKEDLIKACVEGLKELGDLGLVEFKRSATGAYEPIVVHEDWILGSDLIMGEGV